MNRQQWLEALGLRPGERAVVLHADDVGLCQATLEAYRRIHAGGCLSSASVMAPSPWLPALAELCQRGEHDLGVHLVLNSEWSSFRFAPVSGLSAAPSLVDRQGYFWAAARDTHAHARPGEVRLELEAQIQRLRSLGLSPSHLDSHMLTLLAPGLLSIYAELGQVHGLPISLIRLSADGLARLCNIGAEAAQRAHGELLQATAAGQVLFDAWAELPLQDVGDRFSHCQKLLGKLPEGLSLLISHPAVDAPELRALAPDWAARVADAQLHLDPRLPKALEAEGLKLLRMKELMQVWRVMQPHAASSKPLRTWPRPAR